MEARTEVLVVGAGAVGLCAAHYLAEAGCRVVVLDEGGSGRASGGNAGMIVPSHIVPLAAPGVMAKGLRWLLNPESPFYIRLRPDAALLSWLWRFRAACTDAHVRRSIPVLRDLSLASVALFDALEATAGPGPIGYANTGLLMLYNTEKGRRENLDLATLAEAAGLDVERMDREAVQAFEPGIRWPCDGGILYRQDGRVDPDLMVERLEASLTRRGVAVRHGVTVYGFERAGGTVTGVRTSAGPLAAEAVVLAAGAWSGRLARSLGMKLPVQPAKGYSVTVAMPDVPVRVPYILTDEKLTVTPMPGRLRFAGTLALSGFDDTVDERRTRSLRRLVQAYVPEHRDTPAAAPDVWYGYRPCSPDGLPYIGPAPAGGNVVVATGHGMMGITLAPITGKLVAELVQGWPPSLDLAPFAPDRHAA